MIKEQFKIVTPTSSEEINKESIRQEKQQEAESLNNEIMQIKGEKNFEDLEVDELKKVLELYEKIRSLSKGETEIGEYTLEGSIEEQIPRAKEIMGNREVMGPAEVKKAFGIEIAESELPPIPFNEQELKKAKELDQFLVLRVNKAPDGQPLTISKMQEILSDDFSKKGAGKVLSDTYGWRETQTFYTDETPDLGWALTSKQVIAVSTGKNYIEQSFMIADYLEDQVFNGVEMPDEYKEAIKELKDKEEELTEIIKTGDSSEHRSEISKLKLNKLTRQSSAEALYDILIYFQNNDERLLEDEYTLTHTTSFIVANYVCVGYFNFDGAHINYVPDCYSDYESDHLGVVFSRKF